MLDFAHDRDVWEIPLSFKNSIIFTSLIFLFLGNSSLFAQIGNAGGSKVVAGDAFGKYFGGGVNVGIQGWAENNPFGINKVLSGPTRGYCETSDNNVALFNDSSLTSSGPVRSVASLNETLGSSTGGEDLDSEKDYGTGMDRFFNMLDANASLYCGKNDHTSEACRTKSSNEDHGTTKEKNDSVGRCWKYVKIALKESEISQGPFDTGSAILAGDELLNAGFCKVNVSNSKAAPVGAILIYEWTQDRASNKGTRAPEYGHIEVKVAENKYISDYVSDEPIDQKASNVIDNEVQRVFSAAYVKGPCSN